MFENMKPTQKIHIALEEYRVTTGLKPNAIVLSELFMDELIVDLKRMLNYNYDKNKENRFQGIEVLVSKDTVNQVTII